MLLCTQDAGAGAPDGGIDLLRDFSESAREELRSLARWGALSWIFEPVPQTEVSAAQRDREAADQPDQCSCRTLISWKPAGFVALCRRPNLSVAGGARDLDLLEFHETATQSGGDEVAEGALVSRVEKKSELNEVTHCHFPE